MTTLLPFTFIRDAAFQLYPSLMKSFNQSKLTYERRVFNYRHRLSRVRHVVENVFGIISSHFRIFEKLINVSLSNIDPLVMSCCLLRNSVHNTCGEMYMLDDKEDTDDGTRTMHNLD